MDLLLEAAGMLKDRTDREFSIRLAGRGPLRKEMEQLSSALGVSDRVHFLGRLSREKMQAELQAANCFVLPSRYEAFGAVLIEAMATGLPVIATRSGGPDSIVTGENGILVEADRAEALAYAMEKMMEDYAAYDQATIRKYAMESYGASRVLEQYDRLFHELLQS